MAHVIQPGAYVYATPERVAAAATVTFSRKLHAALSFLLDYRNEVRMTEELREVLLCYWLVESRRRDDGSRARLVAHAIRLTKTLSFRDQRLVAKVIRTCAHGTKLAARLNAQQGGLAGARAAA